MNCVRLGLSVAKQRRLRGCLVCSCMLWSVVMAVFNLKEDTGQEAGKGEMILSILVEVVTKALLSPQAVIRDVNDCLLV